MQSMKSDGLILPGAVIDRVIFVCSLVWKTVDISVDLSASELTVTCSIEHCKNISKTSINLI